MKNKLYDLAKLVFFGMLLFSCSKKTEATLEEETGTGMVFLSSEKEKNAAIQMDSLRVVEIDENIKANGVVDVPPQQLASVSVPMAGYVVETAVLPGQHVHRGEVLATLRNSLYVDLQQELVRENSKLTFQTEDYQRQKEMLAGDVTSQRDFQQTKSNFESQKALVKALEEKVKLLGLSVEKVKNGDISSLIYLTSPINGYVKTSMASIGKYCLPETVLFEVTDNSHMHLEVKVFEQDVAKIAKGQKVIFNQPGLETVKMEGEVWLVGKSLDLATRTVGVHVHFDENEHAHLLPGMFVSASILANSRKVLAVPEKAVFRSNNKGYVFCLTNKSNEGSFYEKMNVELGATDHGWVEIANSDVLRSKMVVTEGAYYLNAEMLKPKE